MASDIDGVFFFFILIMWHLQFSLEIEYFDLYAIVIFIKNRPTYYQLKNQTTTIQIRIKQKRESIEKSA